MDVVYAKDKISQLQERLEELESIRDAAREQNVSTREPLIGSKALDYKIKVLERDIESRSEKLQKHLNMGFAWATAHKHKEEAVVECRKKLDDLTVHTMNLKAKVDVQAASIAELTEYMVKTRERAGLQRRLIVLKRAEEKSMLKKPTRLKTVSTVDILEPQEVGNNEHKVPFAGEMNDVLTALSVNVGARAFKTMASAKKIENIGSLDALKSNRQEPMSEEERQAQVIHGPSWGITRLEPSSSEDIADPSIPFTFNFNSNEEGKEEQSETE
jgi:hypothetical protein